MCGIVGFVNPDGFADSKAAEQLLVTMRDQLIHRGPDDGGVWLEPEAGVAFGFRRLSILDLSPAGHQPMLSACGRWAVLMNGEIYNFGDIRTALEQVRGGHPWRGHSDTEVLVEAIAEWGVEAAVSRANGMFAVAAWDRQERILWLVRDRIGKKPLYYGWAGASFVFASELKALFPHPDFDRAAIAPTAVAEFLQLGYVLGQQTIFAGISRLPAGHLLRLDLAAAKTRSLPDLVAYWDLRSAALIGLDAQAAGRPATVEELEALLRDATARRMVADVPVGAFLSGGIDSSLTTALMAAAAPGQVQSFSIGFDVPGWDEARFARPIAAHLGTRHEELYLGRADIIAAARDLPAVYDEPFADDSAIPTLLLCRMARRQVTVALSGDGGDEFFMGYARYAAAAKLIDRAGLLPAPLRALGAGLARGAAPLAGGVGGNRLERRMRLLGHLLGQGGPEAFNAALMSPSLTPDTLLPGQQLGSHPLSASAYRLGRSGALDRMAFTDQLTYLIEDILVKVDRASMSTSLEVRCPLLDYRVMELSWRFSPATKIQGEVGKQPLRTILYRHVPRDLVDRPKQGFGAPVETWLLKELRDWAEALMSRQALSRHGMLDVAACRRLWEGYADGSRGWDKAIWTLLMFQAWHAGVADAATSDVRLAA